jgi:hypothetical protein
MYVTEGPVTLFAVRLYGTVAALDCLPCVHCNVYHL